MFTFAFPKQHFLFWLFSPISCASSDNNMGTQKIFQNSLYRAANFFLSSFLPPFLPSFPKEIKKFLRSSTSIPLVPELYWESEQTLSTCQDSALAYMPLDSWKHLYIPLFEAETFSSTHSWSVLHMSTWKVRKNMWFLITAPITAAITAL